MTTAEILKRLLGVFEDGRTCRVWSVAEINAVKDAVIVLEAAAQRYVPQQAALLKAVDDEPELPGEMPPEMWSALLDAMMKGERETVEEMVRIAVRQTKQGIRERIEALHRCEPSAPEAPRG